MSKHVHKLSYENQLKALGLTYEQITPFIIEDTGDFIVLDDTHPDYAALRKKHTAAIPVVNKSHKDIRENQALRRANAVTEAKTVRTTEDKAAMVKITLEQYTKAEALCSTCPHNKAIREIGVLCAKQGCSACRQFVGFNSKCPINKWNNLKHQRYNSCHASQLKI